MSDDPLSRQPESPQQPDLLLLRWRKRTPTPASTWATVFLWGLAGAAVALLVATVTGFVYDVKREWTSQFPLLCAYVVFVLSGIVMIVGVVGWCIARWRYWR
jgi:hypothetical protein